MKVTRIGGEFEIDPKLLLPVKKETRFSGMLLSSGRSAFSFILSYLKKNYNICEILLPEYLCGSLISTVKKNGFEYTYFNLDENLEIDRDKFPNDIDNKAVLLINYFGLKDTSQEIDFIKGISNDCKIILDNVQALSEMFHELKADFTFASFRKFLPVPDGSWIRAKDENIYKDTSFPNSDIYVYKLLGGITKFYSNQRMLDDELYLNFFKIGEMEIEASNKISSISKQSICIISNLREKLNEIFARRIINANFIIENLRSLGIEFLFDIKSTLIKAPLAIPILLRERDKIRNVFFEEKIFLPVHWPIDHEFNDSLVLAKKISEYELSIVIDQRYDQKILGRIIETLWKCKKEGLL